MRDMNVVLASGSPRRRELLKIIFDKFDVVPSNCEEILPRGTEPLLAAEYLSRLKCEDIAPKYAESLVIGCDTTVISESRILGKPKNKEVAVEMLKLLSGREHFVTTGVTLSFMGQYYSFTERTTVEFYPLSDKEICDYVESGEPMDKAGAYGIQGYGARLVKRIDGDFFNVVGLPVARLLRECERFV